MQPEMGPTRTKRSARAYHTDAPAPSGGYNDAPPQPAPGQAPWQAAAAARVAAYEAQHDQPADDMGHLDQMPGQRNVLSPADQAAARARLAAHQAGIGAGNAPSGGAFTQPMNMGTPGPGSAPQGDGSRIAQPPHHAGQRFAGPRSKIDPDQIPSPVEAQDADQEFFDREWFATCGRGGLPLSTTDFAAVDQGE